MSKQIQDDDKFSDCGFLQLQLGFSLSPDHLPGKISTTTRSVSSLEPNLTLSLSDETKTSTSSPEKIVAGGVGGGVSSPRSTVTSLSVATYYAPPRGVKREMVEIAGAAEEAEVERVSSRGLSACDDDEDGGAARKKLRLTKEQSALLEERFKEHSTLNPKQKQALAKQLNLRPRQVEVWFQNRRARTKLKQTEIDYELLKRCCETLTEENRRLQKELQELKAIKFAAVPSRAMYMQIPASATLTMCPSCDRIAAAAIGEAPKGGGLAKPHFFTSFTHPAAC